MIRLILRLTLIVAALMSVLTVLTLIVGNAFDSDMLWAIYEPDRRTQAYLEGNSVVHGVDLDRGLTVDIAPPLEGYNALTFLADWQQVIVSDAVGGARGETYGIYTYDLNDRTMNTLYEATSDWSAQPTTLYMYGFDADDYQNPTRYALIDPVTSELFIIDAETYERQHILTLTDDDSGDQRYRVARWSPDDEKLATIDQDGSLIIVDDQGDIITSIDVTDQDLVSGWASWINNQQLFLAVFFEGGDNTRILVDLATEEVRHLEEDIRSTYFFHDCDWGLYQRTPVASARSTYHHLDFNTGEATTMKVENARDSLVWEQARMIRDCQHIAFIAGTNPPQHSRRSTDYSGRALQWHDVLIADQTGNTIHYLETVGNFNTYARDGDAFTYIVPGKQPNTYDLMLADWDTPDQPERVATLPQITGAFTWHEDAGYITYTEPGSSVEASTIVYDLNAGREVYRTDERYSVSNFRLVP